MKPVPSINFFNPDLVSKKLENFVNRDPRDHPTNVIQDESRMNSVPDTKSETDFKPDVNIFINKDQLAFAKDQIQQTSDLDPNSPKSSLKKLRYENQEVSNINHASRLSHRLEISNSRNASPTIK